MFKVWYEVKLKLLKVYFDNLKMFEDGIFEIDFYTSDRVPAADESTFELQRPFYTNNILAFAGINASGKTTALNLIDLACRIVNGSLDYKKGLPTAFPLVFNEKSLFRCLVWEESSLFLIESLLVIKNDIEAGDQHFDFEEEEVYVIPSTRLKKSKMTSWSELKSLASQVHKKCKMPLGLLFSANYVSVVSSIITQISRKRQQMVAVRDNGFRLSENFEGLDKVLRVFDSRIEHLEVSDAGRAFSLTFKGQKPTSLSEEGLSEVLSSGTVRGLGLVQRAMIALEHGGYLIVDEIENHLNRQLVNVVLDLFTSHKTNPSGATLVFTTHYPQLLDHIHRKDNVYFLVRESDSGTCAIKYSDRVKRIENKKSEVFVSNYVKGTAPRYSDVLALKKIISERMSCE